MNKEFFNKTREVRKLQKKYFDKRDKDILQQSKQAERELDQMISAFEEPGIPFGGSWDEAKQEIAEEFGKENWARVNYEYEYGIGISKLIDFEELMEKVGEKYKG